MQVSPILETALTARDSARRLARLRGVDRKHCGVYRVLSSVRQSSDVKGEDAWRVHAHGGEDSHAASYVCRGSRPGYRLGRHWRRRR